MAHWLYMFVVAHVPGEVDDMSVDDPLVGDVVGLREEVVVGGGYQESGGQVHPPEPEEVCQVHEREGVEGTHGQVELGVLPADEGVDPVVLVLPDLGVVHQIRHCVVAVPQVVVEYVDRPLVEAAVCVCSIAFLFVSVYEPVEEGDDGVLEGDPLLGVGVEVEGHVVVPLDVHELVVQV